MNDDQSYYSTPDRTEGKWYEMRRGQILWFLAWGALGAAILLLAPTLYFKLLGFPVLLFAAWGAWWAEDGPGYIKLIDRIDSRQIERRSEGYLDPVDPGRKKRKASTAPFNFGLVGIWYDPAPGEVRDPFPTGVMIDYTNGLCTFYFLTHGWDAYSMDWADRMSREQELVAVLSKAVNQVDVEHEKVSVSFINGSRPWSALPTIANLSEQLHDDFVRPAMGTMEATMADNLNERIKRFTMVAAQHVNAIVVTTRLPKSWTKSDMTSFDVEEAAISHIKEALLQGLSAVGVHQPTCLNLLELDEFIQIQRNVSKAGELHQRLFERRQKLLNGTLTVEQAIEELVRSNPFPQHLVRVGLDYFYADGTYFRIYRNRRFGRVKLRPGGLMPLFMSQECPWIMNSSCGDVYSATAEMQRMTRSIVYARGWRRQKDESQVYYSQAELEERTRTERQQNAIHGAKVPVYKFNHFTVVAATSKKELRKFSRKAVANAAGLLIWLMPVRLQARQVRAFANAMLGVNIL